jgi:hypothetical protein
MPSHDPWVPADVDTDLPSVARIYDFLLGGGHNFAVDRAIAERLLAVQPNVRDIATRNRAFMRRAVRFMVREGISQFLDLGSGIPTVGNVHEVAQQVSPDARVVYVDYEDVAVAHSELLLQDNDRAAIVRADVSRPHDVLSSPITQRLLNFDEPVGLLAITVGHYLPPACDPAGVFARYRDALAPGSYLVLTHFTDDFDAVQGDEIIETMKSTRDNVFPRSRAEVLALFGDFELVDPGLVTTTTWRPDTITAAPADDRQHQEDGLYAGVARKP